MARQYEITGHDSQNIVVNAQARDTIEAAFISMQVQASDDRVELVRIREELYDSSGAYIGLGDTSFDIRQIHHSNRRIENMNEK